MSFSDVYKQMLIARGGSVANAIKNDSERYYTLNFKDDPSYRLAEMYDGSLELKPIDIRIISKNTTGEEKQVQLLPNEKLSIGSVVMFDDEIWIVTDFNPNYTSPMGKVLKCNKIIKFIKDGVVYSTPAIITNASKYTLGVTSGISNPIMMGDGRYSIIMPNNSNTLKIKRQDRFIFNESCYQVYDKDITTTKGIITILTGEAQSLTQWDNKELEIADYYKSFDKDSTPDVEDGLIIKSNMGFSIKKYNTNTFTTNTSCVFDVDYQDVSQGDVAVTIVDDTTIKIKNNNCVNGSICICCSDGDNEIKQIVELVR